MYEDLQRYLLDMYLHIVLCTYFVVCTLNIIYLSIKFIVQSNIFTQFY